jgi:hypothetical protein
MDINKNIALITFILAFLTPICSTTFLFNLLPFHISIFNINFFTPYKFLSLLLPKYVLYLEQNVQRFHNLEGGIVKGKRLIHAFERLCFNVNLEVRLMY